jgi:DNA polymerase III delta prime subunit
MIEAASTLKVGADVVAWLWTNKKIVSDVTKWLFRRSNKRPFLIMGAGGVGKTTTARLLKGEFDQAAKIPGVYEESMELETYSLKDDSRVTVVVPPGQVHRRDSTWKELEAGISADKYRGMILVSSFGYHSLGEISYKSLPSYKGDDAKFLVDYTKDRRQEEINVLKRLIAHVATTQKRFWLFNVVTKADLWWPQHQAVRDHYERGEYGRIIDEGTTNLGKTHFRQESAFGSLVISNFVTGRGELLAKTASGYDQHLQREFVQRFWKALTALRKWEGK